MSTAVCEMRMGWIPFNFERGHKLKPANLFHATFLWADVHSTHTRRLRNFSIRPSSKMETPEISCNVRSNRLSRDPLNGGICLIQCGRHINLQTNQLPNTSMRDCCWPSARRKRSCRSPLSVVQFTHAQLLAAFENTSRWNCENCCYMLCFIQFFSIDSRRQYVELLFCFQSRFSETMNSADVGRRPGWCLNQDWCLFLTEKILANYNNVPLLTCLWEELKSPGLKNED